MLCRLYNVHVYTYPCRRTLAIVAMCSASRNHFSAFSEEKKNDTTVGKYCFTLLCIAKKRLVTSFHFYTIATVRKTAAAATAATAIFYHLCNSKIACYHSLCLIHFAFYIHCAHIEKSSKCMRETHAIASYWSTKVNMNNLVSVLFFNGPTTWSERERGKNGGENYTIVKAGRIRQSILRS